MIAIAGPSKRIAGVWTCLSVMSWVIAAIETFLVVTVISMMVFSSLAGSSQFDSWGLKEMLAVSALVVLVLPLWAFVVLFSWIGQCFASGGQSLSIQRKGLFFPIMPGVSKGRFIPWRSVVAIGLLDEAQLGIPQKVLLTLHRLMLPGQVCYVFRLNTRASDLLDTRNLLGKLYKLNDHFSDMLVEPSERRRTVVELLAVPISGERIVTLLNLLLQYEELRDSVTATDEVRTIQSQDEIDHLLSELSSCISGPLASASPDS